MFTQLISGFKSTLGAFIPGKPGFWMVVIAAIVLTARFTVNYFERKGSYQLSRRIEKFAVACAYIVFGVFLAQVAQFISPLVVQVITKF